MKLSEFDYDLPKELIAQYPMEKRDGCRLMVLDRKSGTISHKAFSDITGYFKKGDSIVLNNTKVMQARLFGKRKTGGKVEIFVLERPVAEANPVCEALLRPSGRVSEGERIMLEGKGYAEILGRGEVGRLVRFDRPIEEVLKNGHVPLPPYINRADQSKDKEAYQTVYANKEGATASPTAGLHFTRELLEQLSVSGVKIAYVTLHTSYGTFAPMKVEIIEDHKMHKEYFEFPDNAADVVRDTKKNGGRIFSVGTTSTRVLEHCASAISMDYGPLTMDNIKDYTNMFIYPGYEFKTVDHLITNFHLPKSTLMLLVSAFAGKDFIFEAYREAVKEKYRFFSYGDAMLIL